MGNPWGRRPLAAVLSWELWLASLPWVLADTGSWGGCLAAWWCVQVRRIDGEQAMASDGQFPEIFQLCRERVAQRQTASAGSVGRASLFG
eukprot:COSAG01_NODE_5384_length_4294_cov_1.988796_5_plen_90_part_00